MGRGCALCNALPKGLVVAHHLLCSLQSDVDNDLVGDSCDTNQDRYGQMAISHSPLSSFHLEISLGGLSCWGTTKGSP